MKPILIFRLLLAYAFAWQVLAQADELDDYVRHEMHHRRIPGLALAIVRGSEVSTRAYGEADLESGSPVTPQTVFEVGSLTKPFTAVAVLQLAEEGRLSLDDRLAAHLPDLPPAWQEITVRQLLGHTSGIKDYTEQPGFERLRRLDNAPRDLLALVAAEPLGFTPGARFAYSNTNYVLLGLLLERLGGKSYGDILAARIFAPLGMTQSRVNDAAQILPGRARGYTRALGRTENAAYFSPGNAFAAGNVVASLADLVKWDRALAAGTLPGRESYTAMVTPSEGSRTGPERYGLGWNLGEIMGRAFLAHGGNISGFSSAILHFAEHRLSIIVLSNLGNFNAEKLAQGIAGQVDSSVAKPGSVPLPDTDPATTGRLREIFLGMMNGKMNTGDFNEKLNRELGPHFRPGNKEAEAQGAENGALESFELLERKESEQGTSLVYHAAFEYRMRVKVYISLDPSGKISNWGVRSAD